MRQAIRTVLLTFALAAGNAAPLGAQDSDQPAEAVGENIFVGALALRQGEELPVETSTVPALGPVSRGLVADAARFTRCAGLPRLPQLRRIVDGSPETGETQTALHYHIVRNGGCWGRAHFYVESPFYGVCNPHVVHESLRICRATYDRGAIYEQVLREYAPDLRLSRSNTFDHATLRRFRAREEARNGARTKGARDYFFIAGCMVQLSPQYALALLQEEPGSEREGQLRAVLISDGAPCVGGRVERVSVDPGQFRAFAAEAVYSWAVAVRRTGTLLPADIES